MHLQSLFTLERGELLFIPRKITNKKRSLPFPEGKSRGFTMNLTEEVSKIDAKLEGLMHELNKLKNPNDSQNREAEIREIRSHIKNLEKIREDLLTSKKDIYKTSTIYDSK